MARSAVTVDVGVAVTTVNRELRRCPSPGAEGVAAQVGAASEPVQAAP